MMKAYAGTIRAVLLGLAAVALAGFFFAVRPTDLTAGGQKTVIQIWHPWAGPILESYGQGVRAFEQSHPDIACQTLYITNDLANSQKFYTAVVGNCAPT